MVYPILLIVAGIVFVFSVVALAVQLLRRDSRFVILFVILGAISMVVYLSADIANKSQTPASDSEVPTVQKTDSDSVVLSPKTEVAPENAEENANDALIAKAGVVEDGSSPSLNMGSPASQDSEGQGAQNAEGQVGDSVVPSEQNAAQQLAPEELPEPSQQPSEEAKDLNALLAGGEEIPAQPENTHPESQPLPTAAAPAVPAVVEVPGGPVAKVGKNVDDGKLNEEFVFDGSISKKGKNGKKIVQYSWNFGDGTSAEGKKVKHSFANIGEYTVTLTVTDESGAQAQATQAIKICRPDARVRAVDEKLPNIEKTATSPSDKTGSFDKKYGCGKASIELKTYVVSTLGCTCVSSVKLSGLCKAQQSKNIDNGGEGEILLRANCVAAEGSVSWSLQRQVKGSGCTCSWSNSELLVSEI